jgi:hypothetical protein
MSAMSKLALPEDKAIMPVAIHNSISNGNRIFVSISCKNVSQKTACRPSYHSPL